MFIRQLLDHSYQAGEVVPEAFEGFLASWLLFA
jgi:hypothetical protein